jgi:L-malate glycosyltransferase
MKPISIVYLLSGTGLFGGSKVALHQAHLLQERGHRVLVQAEGPKPEWFPVTVPFRQVERHDPLDLPEHDVCIATFWPTLPVAAEAPCRRAVHYCQGYEGSFPHNRDQHEAIEAAYRLPLPAEVVSPHLGELLAERFDRPSRWVPQPLEAFWKPRPGGFLRRSPRRVPRILVPSPFEIEWKGVATALEAVRGLRREGQACRLVRLSQWPLSDAEREILEPDEYHQHLTPPEVARLMAGCDLLLAPSWEQEGFGLPVLEGMACGVPVIATDIPSFRGFAADAATLVPPRDGEALAAAAAEVLGTGRRWRAHRKAGLALAGRFTEERSCAAAEEFLAWALDGPARPSESPTLSAGRP